MNPILKPILNNSKDASTVQTRNNNPANASIGKKTSHRLMNGNIHLIARKNSTPTIANPYPIFDIIANFFYSKYAVNFIAYSF